jgi:hypothetical protein
MTSQARIDANRINAQKSTGPSSEEGKAKTRFNAVTHGAYIVAPELTGQDPEALEQRRQDYLEEYQPVGAEEIYFVDTMLAAHSEQEACVLLANAALDYALQQVPEDSPNRLGEATAKDFSGPNCFDKLARRASAANRRWLRSLKLLRHHQMQRFQLQVLRDQHLAEEQGTNTDIDEEIRRMKEEVFRPQPTPKPAAAAPEPEPNPSRKPKKGGLTGNEPPEWRL